MGKIDFQIGEFDSEIVFFSPVLIRTNSGAVEKKFEKTEKCFAKISTKSISEDVAEGLIILADVKEVITYHIDAIRNDWRLDIDGIMYDIISKEVIQRRFMKVVSKRVQ